MNKDNKSIWLPNGKDGKLIWFPNQKKAAEMTIGTIIVIILSLIVLAVIVYGFTTGWGNLWENIKNFGGGRVNVGSVVQGCNVACASVVEYDYCTLTRKIVFDETGTKNKDNNQLFTCKQLESKGVGLSCDNLECPGISQGKTCLNSGGKWQVKACDISGKTQEDITSVLTNTDDKGVNVYCCKSTCLSLKGIWKPTACEPSTQIDITIDITDKSDQGSNTHCCKAK